MKDEPTEPIVGRDFADLAWDGVQRALSDFRDAGGDPFDLGSMIRNAVVVEVNRAILSIPALYAERDK